MKKQQPQIGWWTNLNNQQQLEDFRNEMAKYSINEELIGFIESTIKPFQAIEKKVIYLYYAKKVLPFLTRVPDPKHYDAFQENYDFDQENFNPKDWIDNELNFLNSVNIFSKEKSTSSEVSQAKFHLSKTWLNSSDMEEMFHFSRTTLNRRIAEGMPCHKKGKSTFFNLEEVGEWLKDEEI